MKVAFCIRDSYLTQRGGDTIQCTKTKQNLEALFDINVDIITDAAALNDSYDIIHIFNLATAKLTETFIDKAKALQKPRVALSPIFWNYQYNATKDVAEFFNYSIPVREWQGALSLAFVKFTAVMFNKPRMIAAPFRTFCRRTVEKADMLLPNSAEELNELGKFIGSKPGELAPKSHVVVNATDFPDYSQTDVCKEYAIPENFVLQVGRIEYTKGQLNVVKALFKLPEIPVVFIGWVNSKPYADKLHKLAHKRGNVFFLDEVPHDKIYSFYKKAALHILPSLRESPGLVSLEALSQGCKIVTASSRFTPSDTYFKGISTIINPFSVPSIKKGILQEMHMQRNMAEIAVAVRSRFTWANAAKATYEGYKKML